MKLLPEQMAAFLRERGARRNFAFFLKFSLTLCLMIALYSALFHWLMLYEGRYFSPITGVYWTLTVMSTLGFGDITFTSDPGRIFSIVVLVSGIILLLIILPFTFLEHFYRPWLESQKKRLVPRELPAGTRGHVIIAGSGPISLNLADDLARHDIRRIVLCNDPQNGLDLLDQGYEVVAGDHDDIRTYQNLRADAAAMLVVLESGIRSPNIVFSAREAAPKIPIAGSAETPEAADILRTAGCSRAFLFHRMLGEALSRRVLTPMRRAGIQGSFGRLTVAEAPLLKSPLVGRTIVECGLRERTGVNVVGVWERGVFQLPGPTTTFTESTILVLAGTERQMAAFDAHLRDPDAPEREPAPVLILGGGRVGLSAARSLAKRGMPAVIVDRKAEIRTDGIPHVRGDAADLNVLEKAGIHEAAGIVITTHDDDTNIYLTIYCRRLRPDAQILCRASRDRNVNGLYSAGADQVLSLASLVSRSVVNLLSPDKMLMLNERLLIFRHTIQGRLQGQSLKDCGIRGDTSCNVLAVRDTKGDMHVNPAPDRVFALGEAIYLIGDAEAEERFRAKYGIDGPLSCEEEDLN